jgi:small-conductance mechanosensitive channel
MQKLVIFFIIISSIYSAEIDKSLFESDNIEAEFQRIEKDINRSISQKLKSPKIISLETSTLKKLKKIYRVKDDIKPFETLPLNKKKISQKEYLKAFFLILELQSEIERLNNKEKIIQEKLFSLKNEIQKSLQSETNHQLLNNQMLYAFYKISQEKIKKSLKLYNELYEKGFERFESTLNRVSFKEHIPKKIIKKVDTKIDSLKDKNLLLSIDKDSEALQNSKEKKIIIKKEQILQQETDETIIKKLEAQVTLALKWLKEKNQEEFLNSIKKIENDIKLLSQDVKKKYQHAAKLLLILEERRFDDTSVALASTQIGFKYIKESIQKVYNKTLFVYEEKAFSLKTIFTFTFFIFIGFIIARIYKKIVDKFRKTKRIKSLSVARMLANSGYYLIILSTFFIALKSIGLNLHTIFLITGAILLWIALGLQGFISNYAMGILLRIDRSIRIGDLVELDINTIGQVDDMDFRAVTILTGDHTRITIPNTRFMSGSFINHSIEEQIRRVHVPFSADNTIEHRIIQEAVLEGLENSTIKHIRSSNKRAQVIITDINRKIVRYSLLVWIDHHDRYDMPVEKSAFLEIIHQSLKKVAL